MKIYGNQFDVTVYHVMVVSFTKLMGLLKMVYLKKTKHVKAYTNNKYNLITLGGVNEVVSKVLTSVTDQK
jgi:hypothetical protein